MEYLEAFVVHVLVSESFNIFLDEFIVCLISLDWVAQVILVNGFLVVAQEAAYGFDARSRLQVLGSEELVQLLLKRRASGVGTHLEG